ncbi:hypothetical protein FHT70_001880, partial [Rhizobium sp. BK049]|nr:hypothetical protein [Rhizobium sp. BK049]
MSLRPVYGEQPCLILAVLWRPFGLAKEDCVGENDEFSG